MERTTTIDLRPLRIAGIAMFAVAIVLPFLPRAPFLPCPLRTVTGVPCAFCGMTRSVTAAVHGDVVGSLALNPGGLALIAFAVALLVVWRWRSVTIPVWLIVGGFSVLWIYQLFKYTTGRPL